MGVLALVAIVASALLALLYAAARVIVARLEAYNREMQ